MLAVKIIENDTMYSVQQLHLCIFSRELHSMELHSVKVISAVFTSSTFSVNSSSELCSANLSTNFFLRLQFSQSKYSPASYDLSHSHLQLLGLQIDPFLHTSLYQLILCIHTCIYHHSNVVYYYKRWHLIYIYTYTFHVILCASFHKFLTLHSIELYSTDLHLIKLLIPQKTFFQ